MTANLWAILFDLKIYLFIFGYVGSLLLLGLFLVGVSGVYSLAMVLGLLIMVASLIVEHRLSNSGTGSLLLRGMWDLPGPGTEPVSPELAGRFLSTVPPGESLFFLLKLCSFIA